MSRYTHCEGRRGLEEERSHGVQAACTRILPTILIFWTLKSNWQIEIHRGIHKKDNEPGSVAYGTGKMTQLEPGLNWQKWEISKNGKYLL